MKSGITNCTSLIFKNFKKKRNAFLLEGLVIAVATMIVFSIVLAAASELARSEEKLRVTSNYHAVFYGKEEAVKNIKKGADAVQWVGIYNEDIVTIEKDRDAVPSVVRFYENEDGISSDYIIKGKMPENGEILLPDSVLLEGRNAVWQIGEEVVLKYADEREEKYTISGFYSYNLENNPITEGPAITFDAYSGNNTEIKAEVWFKGGNIVGKSKKLSEKYGLSGYDLNTARVASELMGKDEKYANYLFILAIVLAIALTSYLMIRGIIGMRASDIHKQNAILRSFGTRKKTIHKLSVLECIYICIPSIICGVLLSISIYIIAASVTGVPIDKSLDFIKDGFLAGFVVSALDIVLVTIIAMFVNVQVGLKQSISEILLTDQEVIISSKKRKGKGFKNPVKAYIFTSITRNGLKTLVSIIPFTIGVIYIVVVAATSMDLQKMTGNGGKVKPVYNANITLRSNYEKVNTSDELIEFVSNLDGVEKVKPDYGIINMTYNIDEDLKVAEFDNEFSKENGIYDNLMIYTYDEAELKALKPVMVEGTNEILDSGCILVNYAYPLMKNGKTNYEKKEKLSALGVGDSLTIVDIGRFSRMLIDVKRKAEESGEEDTYVAGSVYKEMRDNPGEGIDIEIKGIAEYALTDYNMFCPTIIMSEEYYRKLVGDENYTNYLSSIQIKLKDGVKLYDIRGKLWEKSGLYDVYYGDVFGSHQIIDEEGNTVTSKLGIIFLIIAVIVGVITLFSTIMMNWRISKKEYAILKSSGASNKNIVKLILTEKSIICLSSFVIGTVIGMAIEKSSIKVLAEGGKIPFTLPIPELIITLAAMLALTLLLTAFQSSIIKKMSIADVLKESRS